MEALSTPLGLTASPFEDRPYLTDGGLETYLIYHRHLDLPAFAAFPLLATPGGQAELLAYYRRFAELARARGAGLVLEAPTWRASPDWAAQLGYDAAALDRLNHEAIALMRDVRGAFPDVPTVISGQVGPRGDGYVAGVAMTAEEAEAYHAAQVGAFAEAGADLVSAITMTYAEEAIGVARAARVAGLPAVVSFTVETDGRLPSGQALADAVAETDRATDAAPVHYMVNCAHPTHFADVLAREPGLAARVGGLRVNASRRSHAELDAATELDEGDPAELAREHRALAALLPSLRVVGGCCGTDHRHVEAICGAVFPQ